MLCIKYFRGFLNSVTALNQIVPKIPCFLIKGMWSKSIKNVKRKIKKYSEKFEATKAARVKASKR
jgi:hypothetical protein